MHPQTVVYLEHDGKLLLVNEDGHGPQDCIMGRQDVPASLRFPTIEELTHMASNGMKSDKQMYDFLTRPTPSFMAILILNGQNIGHGKTRWFPTTQFIPLFEKLFTVHFIVWYQK